MRNLDKPKHGWEGLSNGGEIWGNNSSHTNYNYGNDMLEKAQEINDILDSIKLDEEIEETQNLGVKESEDVLQKEQEMEIDEVLEKLRNGWETPNNHRALK